MKIDVHWDYEDFMTNMRELRKEYIKECNSFDYKHLHDRVMYRSEIKKTIYNLDFNEKQKNIIWCSLNRGYRNPLKVVIPNVK